MRFRAYLHDVRRPLVGEVTRFGVVTRFGGITRLSIKRLILI